jgi:hypothetical protein
LQREQLRENIDTKWKQSQGLEAHIYNPSYAGTEIKRIMVEASLSK